ncbi:hypothetical protein FISHEDRAFT_78903 [Fistulina hepatica ATCC 64428]|uniref:Uncharacterized protein n=1 Tax=Fistulina hepatica ATCC 64428 TaxID=1128425 RepID=A0A0D6ZZ04_9AGAR|nr:hypothetical protein FISHEDRAFT_78903 [Fistulina hepatica ATCC 64428]
MVAQGRRKVPARRGRANSAPATTPDRRESPLSTLTTSTSLAEIPISPPARGDSASDSSALTSLLDEFRRAGVMPGPEAQPFGSSLPGEARDNPVNQDVSMVNRPSDPPYQPQPSVSSAGKRGSERETMHARPSTRSVHFESMGMESAPAREDREGGDSLVTSRQSRNTDVIDDEINIHSIDLQQSNFPQSARKSVGIEKRGRGDGRAASGEHDMHENLHVMRDPECEDRQSVDDRESDGHNSVTDSEDDRSVSKHTRRKGKGPDLQNLGQVGLTDAEVDPETQAKMLANFKKELHKVSGGALTPRPSGSRTRNESPTQSDTSTGNHVNSEQDNNRNHRTRMKGRTLWDAIETLRAEIVSMQEFMLRQQVLTDALLAAQLQDATNAYDREHEKDVGGASSESNNTPSKKKTGGNPPPGARKERFERTRPSRNINLNAAWRKHMEYTRTLCHADREEVLPDGGDPDGDSSDEDSPPRDSHTPGLTGSGSQSLVGRPSRLKPIPPEIYTGVDNDEYFWKYVQEANQYLEDGNVPPHRQVDIAARFVSGKAEGF